MRPASWHARSLSRPLAERLTARDLRLRVLSAHRRACNLVSQRGDLVALVPGSVGNGPFHIVLADPAPPLYRWRPGSPARCHRDHLQIGDISIDLQGAEVWEPRVAWPDPPVGVTALVCLAGYFTAWLSSCTSGVRPPPLWLISDRASTALLLWPVSELASATTGMFHARVQGHASPAVEVLLAGLRAGDKVRVTGGVETLAGLGPGLTPAGDDFLVGLMAGLRVRPGILATGWTAEYSCRLIARIAAGRTATLSAAWIRHAAAGEFSQPWHELVRALASADERSIRRAAHRILATGATSGADAMAGFLAPWT